MACGCFLSDGLRPPHARPKMGAAEMSTGALFTARKPSQAMCRPICIKQFKHIQAISFFFLKYFFKIVFTDQFTIFTLHTGLPRPKAFIFRQKSSLGSFPPFHVSPGGSRRRCRCDCSDQSSCEAVGGTWQSHTCQKEIGQWSHLGRSRTVVWSFCVWKKGGTQHICRVSVGLFGAKCSQMFTCFQWPIDPKTA